MKKYKLTKRTMHGKKISYYSEAQWNSAWAITFLMGVAVGVMIAMFL